MNPLAHWLSWLTRRHASRKAERALRKREAILRQIRERRARHRAFRPLYGLLNEATNEALRYEVLARKGT